MEILCIDETKLDSSFPNAQIHLPDYQFPTFQTDRNSSGGGKIVYIRNRIIVKRLTVYEVQNTESIYVEITIKKRKWRILFTYRPPNNNNLKLFIEETTHSANQPLSKCDNIIIAGDFNIDTSSKNCNKFKQFADFCHTFDLTNLINVKTCFKSATSQSSLDFILTNRPRSFKKQPLLPQGLVITIN